MREYHRVRFDLNASHSPDGTREHRHPHTFTFGLTIGRGYSENEMQDVVESWKARYEMTCLNEQKAFQGTRATLEDIGNIFFRELSREMKQRGMELLELAVGDHPTAVYAVHRAEDC